MKWDAVFLVGFTLSVVAFLTVVGDPHYKPVDEASVQRMAASDEIAAPGAIDSGSGGGTNVTAEEPTDAAASTGKADSRSDVEAQGFGAGESADGTVDGKIDDPVFDPARKDKPAAGVRWESGDNDGVGTLSRLPPRR